MASGWRIAGSEKRAMELSNVVGIWSALMTTPQAIGAICELVDRRRKKQMKTGSAHRPNKFNSLALSVMVIGTAVTVAFATWMLIAKPLRPKIQTVEKTVYVDKYLPCPPEKTGNARTGGAQSPATTGSGNVVTYGTPSKGSPQQ